MDRITSHVPRIAIVWRGDGPVSRIPDDSRLRPISMALEAGGMIAVPVVYSEQMSSAAHKQLRQCDGALVWVDPLTNGKTRAGLDALLRDVAAQGVWVSAHPDVILKMGTKEVLYRARDLGWGTDTVLYRSVEDFRAQFPERLEASRIRVLKQYRGNGGQGVWKVSLQSQIAGPDAVLMLQEAARRDDPGAQTTLDAFMKMCETYFTGEGRIIDQQFQPRIVEGMVRCYMSGSTLVGFARQYPEGYGQGITPEATFGLPSAKTMLPPDEPQFQTLRNNLERDWVPKLRDIVGLGEAQMPALWDADFLFGPMDGTSADTFVLCEINASCVSPFPREAPAAIARYAAARLAMRAGN